MEERARFLRTEAARVKREFEIVQNRERQAGPALQQTPPPGTPQTPPGATTPALQDGQEPPPPQPTDDRWGL
jgi:hypothetical protein